MAGYTRSAGGEGDAPLSPPVFQSSTRRGHGRKLRPALSEGCAPSSPADATPSQNWQPWDFILVTDRRQLRELAKVWRGAGHVAQSAATIVVVGPAADNEFHRAQFDLGQATMAMLLAAADLGIGSCHAGVADIELARQLLGLPQDRDWALLISLGYPADRPLAPIRNPDRRPYGEVVHHGRW